MKSFQISTRALACIFAAALCFAAGIAKSRAQEQSQEPRRDFVGFDRNDYPGDAALPALKRHFDFAGYWLTNPPGEQQNTWVGKRQVIAAQGFGFLVLANGKTDAEIKASRKDAAALGQRDGAGAVAAAVREGFPPKTVLFLDQEEGGRLLPEQAAYLFGWTEIVAASDFRPGVYSSGQPVNEGHGQTITTAQDIATQIASRHLNPVVMWAYQDACPPSNGCTLHPPALSSSGTVGAEIWQYAQSPRRRAATSACAKTYAPDGNCYVRDPALAGIFVDLNLASSPDPSRGR
jgi:hypothetical protein